MRALSQGNDTLEGMNITPSDPAQRIGATNQPTVVLDRATEQARAEHTWEGLPAALISGDERLDYERPYAVLGGPGTGKTSVLVDAAVEFLLSGGSAEELMFVTPTKESASQIRTEIFERVRESEGYAATGAPVRSVHAWAFALARSIRQRQDAPLPRLISGAEHDAQIRILLRGEVEDGLTLWPESMMPALTFVGFARQLRDLLLRATERGMTADELQQVGAQFSRPMWEAAGAFLARYNQAQRLGESWNLNASELLHSVIHDVENTPAGQDVALRQREQLRLVLVDDAHNFDPASARLIEQLIAPGTRAIIAGDPDQCVFHFRGADEAFLSRHAAHEDYRVVLSHSHRLSDGQAQAVRALTAHLPHSSTRIPVQGTGREDAVRTVLATSSMAEKLYVADAVRRAHVVDEVPWENIAVIVRGTGQISSLRRVLLSHGVPVTVDPTSQVLAQQPLVAVLLLAVESVYRRLTVSETRQLLESSVGGADPVMVRRVERALGRAIAHLRTQGQELPVRADGQHYQAADCLADLLAGQVTALQREEWTAFMGPRELTVIQRVTQVIEAGREAYAAHAGVEAVLWKVWQATELSTRLQTRALRGGTLGSQADQDLDAVMSLFDLAGDFAERNPQASVQTFVGEVRAQELPTGTRDRRGTQSAAVEILPAHAAAGREWDAVIVSGVQEDLWPAGPTVGGLFGQLELVDYLDRHIDPNLLVSRIGPAIEEERRLFLLALSRARRTCVVTAVDNDTDDGGVPSRFLTEIRAACEPLNAALRTTDTEEEIAPLAELPRVLALEPLVGELRDAVSDTSRPTHVREDAARNLAKMARAGIFGAHPSQWWGTAEPSTQDKLLSSDGTVRLSPSRLESLTNCALSTFFDRHRGVEKQTEHQRVGNAVHAIAEAIVGGLSLDDALTAVDAIVPLIAEGPQWRKTNLLNRWREGITRLHAFLETRATDAEGYIVASERILSVPLGVTEDGYDIVLNGRIDLSITGPDGATIVYDFKTSRSAKSRPEAQASPQLAAYQFMVARTDGMTNDGAALVYPGTNDASIKVVQQDAMNSEEVDEFGRTMLELAAAASGPEFRATPGKHCDFCDFATSCPAQTAGRTLV